MNKDDLTHLKTLEVDSTDEFQSADHSVFESNYNFCTYLIHFASMERSSRDFNVKPAQMYLRQLSLQTSAKLSLRRNI